MSQMSDNVFRVDFRNLVIEKLITLLRTPKQIKWLQGLTVPVIVIYDQFTALRVRDLYSLNHNGQVCRLRKVLNDAFDPFDRRITIADGNKYLRQYIYTRAEDKPRYLGTIYLRDPSDYADTGVDFRVLVPAGFDLEAVKYQMQATIDFYKLASKRYKIDYDE